MSRFREALSTAATVVLVICAVAVTAAVVRREFLPPAGGGTGVGKLPGWEALAAEGSMLGPGDAPVRIVAFSDFQCPFCAKAVPELNRLLASHRGRVAVVFRHFPLEAIHPYAAGAAMAAECAGAQGRFRPYHDALFAAQEEIGRRSWTDFARTAGVPSLSEFEACVREERFGAQVRRDLAAAKAAGVNSTPTFIFDGLVATGEPGLKMLEKRVAAAVRRS